MTDLTALSGAIMAAEREAAVLMLSARDVTAEAKTDRRNVVTDYDRRVQRLLTERLREALPTARFYCEEMNEQEGLDSEALFIIDPIDGTMNFARGLGCSCISVAYAEKGEVLLGAVYNPYLDEMFFAEKGRGAYLNGQRLHVSGESLENSLVCFGTAPYAPRLARLSFRLAEELFERSLDLRRGGSAALDLCSVAAGRAGLYFELELRLWDYAAGQLLVREAGGVCLTAEGAPLPFDGSLPAVCAGNADCVEAFLKLREEAEWKN